MRSEKIGVFAHHLRLKPDSEFETYVVYLLNKVVQTAAYLIGINEPVAESCIVISSFAEPSIVHHQKLNTHLLCCFGNFYELPVIKIEEGCFPGVDRDRTSFADKLAIAHSQPEKVVIEMTESGKSVFGECHDHFRCLK